MDKKPDKYDEDGLQWAKELLETISDEIQWIGTGGIPDSRWIEVVGAGIAMRLRSAFPPPAEDARQLAEKYSDADGCMLSTLAIEKLSAEIESFAQSRVEPWREALRGMVSVFGFDEDEREHEGIALVNARALLSDSLAKEADR